MTPSKAKSPKKPKLTNAERFKRFVDMAREVEASEKPEDFEKAFKTVAHTSSEASDGKSRSRQRSKPTEK
jgi:hypothetical protein